MRMRLGAPANMVLKPAARPARFLRLTHARAHAQDMKHIPMLTPKAVIASVGTQVWWLTETPAGDITAEKDLDWDRSLGHFGVNTYLCLWLCVARAR